MRKAIIIEDELGVRSALKKMLKLMHPGMKIVAETGSVSEAVVLLKEHEPELIFLDIELEDGTGFDILNQFESIGFKIIFTTAYSEYAIKAFKYSSIDYLLKPVDPMELKDAVTRAFLSVDGEREHKALLEVLRNNIEKRPPKIVLKTTEQRHIIDVENIIRLEADGAYTSFVLKNKKIIVSRNIKHYQNILGEDFIRCHQSHLVNSNHIKGVDKQGALMMSSGDLVPVSTRKRAEIVQRIKNL